MSLCEVQGGASLLLRFLSAFERSLVFKLKENSNLKCTRALCTRSNSVTHDKSTALGVVCPLASIIAAITGAVSGL